MARTQPRIIFPTSELEKFEVNLQNLERAVNSLFKGSHSKFENVESGTRCLDSNTYFAHQWLIWVQKSPAAWDMIWYVITPRNQRQNDQSLVEMSPELQYFGANTLQFKIQKSLTTLSDEDIVSLRDKLFMLITTTSPGASQSALPKFVHTRILVSLAAFIVRTVGDGHQLSDLVWGPSGDPVGQLVNLFSNGQAVQSLDAHSRLNILLQLLTFIPEEYATSFLSKRLRNYVQHYCSQTAMPCVLNLVMTFLKVSATTVEQKSSALK